MNNLIFIFTSMHECILTQTHAFFTLVVGRASMGLISSLDRTIARKNTSDKISQLSRVLKDIFNLIFIDYLPN